MCVYLTLLWCYVCLSNILHAGDMWSAGCFLVRCVLCTQLKIKFTWTKGSKNFVWWTNGQKRDISINTHFLYWNDKEKEVRAWRWLGFRLSQNNTEKFYKMRLWLELVFHHDHYYCHFCLFIWWGCKVARYGGTRNMCDTFGGRHDVGKMYDWRRKRQKILMAKNLQLISVLCRNKEQVELTSTRPIIIKGVAFLILKLMTSEWIALK